MKTLEKGPRVSIGLPVYNCDKYVGRAIESVLAQTFKDFELIISDNASADQTEKICREYAAKNSRIRYYRNEKNLGAAKNFNRLFELASGEYFKWLAADDELDPEFLGCCVDLLDSDHSIILVFSKTTNYIESTNKVFLIDDDLNLMSSKTYQRFAKALSSVIGHCRPIWGLIRLQDLRETRLIRPFIGADDCLLLELALKGKFAQLPDKLYHMRSDHPWAYHVMRYRNQGKEGALETRWFDTESTGKIFLPHWRRLWEYFLLVIRSQDRFGSTFIMLLFLFCFGLRWYRWLGSELIFAVGLWPYYNGLKKTVKKCISIV